MHLFTAAATRATATAPQVMLHRRPASPCCACLPAPAAHCGLGSLWAASAVSGHYPHHGKCLVFGIHWFNRPTDCMLSPAASPQSQLVRFGCKPGFSPGPEQPGFVTAPGFSRKAGSAPNPGFSRVALLCVEYQELSVDTAIVCGGERRALALAPCALPG